MEHRIGKRKKLYGYVELWQGNIKRGDFELVNIGAGGLFLKGKLPELNEGEVLTIKSHFDNQADIDGYHLKVMVVHLSEEGVGLMWAGCHTSFFESLEIVLNRAA